MPGKDKLQTARDIYGAYVSGERSVVEAALSDDFTFYSPPTSASTARAISSAAGRTRTCWSTSSWSA